MSTSTSTPYETFLKYMELGITRIVVDTRKEGVVVPPPLLGNPSLHLNYSYGYGIPDLSITKDEITATLSFGGEPFFVRIPFEAVLVVGAPSGFYVEFPNKPESTIPSEITEEGKPEVLLSKRHLCLVSFNPNIPTKTSKAPLYLVPTPEVV